MDCRECLILDDFYNHKISSIFVKVTGSCNLRCDYCYYLNRHNDDQISPEILEKLISDYVALAESKGYKGINLVWHGGEPLVAGRDMFERIVSLEKKLLSKNLVLTNYVQTNGTLIDDEWANFLKRNKFQVGVSLDGPKKVNDQHRNQCGGVSSFEKTLNGIRLLQKNKIPFGVLSVVTEKNYLYYKDSFDFFIENKIPVVDFTPGLYEKSSSDSFSPTPEHFGTFLISMYELWKEKKEEINITILNDLLNKVKSHMDLSVKPYKTMCELSGHCGRNLSMLSNGDVYPCECLINLKGLKLGNISNSSLVDMLSSKNIEPFKKSVNNISRDCFSCEIFDVCKGGCFHRRLSGLQGYENKDYCCKARKMIVQHIVDDLKPG